MEMPYHQMLAFSMPAESLSHSVCFPIRPEQYVCTIRLPTDLVPLQKLTALSDLTVAQSIKILVFCVVSLCSLVATDPPPPPKGTCFCLNYQALLLPEDGG
jgi:hypothetical protein